MSGTLTFVIISGNQLNKVDSGICRDSFCDIHLVFEAEIKFLFVMKGRLILQEIIFNLLHKTFFILRVSN